MIKQSGEREGGERREGRERVRERKMQIVISE